MRRFFPPVLIAAIVLLGAMVSCEKSGSDILGKWQAGKEDSAMVWEFSPGGSVQMGSTRGRYTFGDQSRLKIETSAATSIYQITLSGDQMTLRDPRGSKLEFSRVK